MKTGVKIAIWAVVIGSLAFAGTKAYKLYKAKQLAKEATV